MKLIIEHPEWQAPKQRILLGFITLIFWMAWFYLWLPFVSVLAWIFGIKTFQYHMLELAGLTALIELLGWYALVIFVLGGSLIAWATYNIQRFNQVARRSPRPEVSIEMQARYFKVDVNDVEVWRKSQRIFIEYNDHSQISKVRVWSTQQQMETDVLLSPPEINQTAYVASAHAPS
jgi:poly-beta-1,6-N-acetyl-D-glucosamine biosynthesis protein PgaD